MYFSCVDLRRDYLNNTIMDFLKDLWQYLKVRKKWWLLPVIVILLLFGVLIVISSGSAIAPFIYTLF
jgi:NAD/NADP transhydrogenase beta subunit